MATGNEAYRRGDLRRALAEYEKAAGFAPGLVQARVNLGSLLLRAGHLDRAAQEYRAALAIDPTLEDVRKGLESIEARRRRAADSTDDSPP
jgi:tetratricopeptide (TPR) repeat protein